MEDDIVNIIVAVIYQYIGTIEKIKARNPYIPNLVLTDDFRKKILLIIYFKGRIVIRRWKKFVDTCYSKMFSSHEAYLAFVMFACIREHERNGNVFDSFMSLHALLNFISIETEQKIGVDLHYLKCFIFMHFYRVVLIDIIYRQGGGHKLIEYISRHRYLKFDLEQFESPEAAISLGATEMNLNKQIEKELKLDRVVEEKIDADEIANDESCRFVARDILKSCPDIEQIANLPSLEDVVKRLVEYRKKGKAKRKLPETADDLAASNSITESKRNYATKYQDNIEQYESIIQAVIRHNLSNSSGHESANNKIPEEADVVLQHLEEIMENLTKVLISLTKIE